MIDKDDSRYETEARKREEKYDSISSYLEKEEAIEKEKKRLKRQFSKIDGKKKNLVETTIEDVAFMAVIMRELRENISRDGTKAEYKNGENQYGTKQSPDMQNYLQLSQKHTAAMKILLDCLPKTEKQEQKDDGFNSFIAGRGNN